MEAQSPAAAGFAHRCIARIPHPHLPSGPVEVLDVAPGLWLWRQPHPSWQPGEGWNPDVSSFAVTSGGVSLVLDPLAPAPSARAVWDRIETVDVVAVLKPDHVRDVDLFVRWYGARAYGPQLFWRDDIPKTELTRCGRATSCPAACAPSTTAAGCTRRRCTSPSSAR